VLAAGALALLTAIVAGLAIGSTSIPVSRVLSALLSAGGAAAGASGDPDAIIVLAIRAPRVVVAVLVGAALAVAGAQMQGLFQNPMASPDIIATSAGAALGAVLALVLGVAQQSALWLPILAFAGALASLFVVYTLTTRGGRTPVAMLLLAGVALSTLLAAITSFLITIHWVRVEVAQEVVFWLLGGLDSRTWTHVWLAGVPIALGLVAALAVARDLDLFLSGEEAAASLGVDVERVKRAVLVIAALLTGAAVAVSGVVGFVGLIVPHAVRLLVGPAHRRVIPMTALVGATFLVVADLVARTALTPHEISLGVVTACCGAPFFLWLLLRYRREVGYL
jgi:iron complex transport system permease protein